MKHLTVILSLTIIAMSACKKPVDQDANIESKIDSLISQMTLEEKIGMIHASSSFTSGGVERLGIPELVMSDGPHGVRHEHGRDWEVDSNIDFKCTYQPTGICLAATWNKELGYQFGSVLGSEAKARGKDIILGPGINILRSPLCGRNFEYLSEDPYLNSRMAVGYIKGVQDQGIAACVKHYLANNQETWRFSVDVNMSERALREIYLPAFKASVEEAGVHTIMGAYNQFRGQHCSHHSYLLDTVLKQEMGFTGAVISDWDAVHDTKEALTTGLDIEMGSELATLPVMDYSKFFLADAALAMIKSGKVDENYVDEKVRRILRVMFRINVFGERTPGEINTKEHQQNALKVAEEGVVLLKNEKQTLPLELNMTKTIAVIGFNAIDKHAEEGGSSQVPALYEITPLEGIKNLVGENAKVEFVKGYDPWQGKKQNKKLVDEAIKLASSADIVLYFGGWLHNENDSNWGKVAYDREGMDKKDIIMPYGQSELINKLTEANPNIAVTIFGGSPVEMNSWLGNVPALLHCWYPGMEGGNALANIIFGKTNPSGKLPMTFANSYMDYPSHKIGEYPGIDEVVHYNEGIFVGYRYFTTENIEPVFPFGYGLSYTNFELSDIQVSQNNGKVTVNCTIANTGEREGKEVVQLYIHPLNPTIERPVKELKGFEKIAVAAGESKQVSFDLTENAFKYYDEDSKSWKLDSVEYEIQLGNSVEDVQLSSTVSF